MGAVEKTFTESMKDSLLALKEEIIHNLISESADFKALVDDMDPKDLVDVAADDIAHRIIGHSMSRWAITWYMTSTGSFTAAVHCATGGRV